MKTYLKPEISILSVPTGDIMTASGILGEGIGNSVILDWDSLENGD